MSSHITATLPGPLSEDDDEITELPRHYGRTYETSRFRSIDELMQEAEKGSSLDTALVSYSGAAAADNNDLVTAVMEKYKLFLEGAPRTTLTDMSSVLTIIHPEPVLTTVDKVRTVLHRYLSQFSAVDPLTLAIGQSPGEMSADQRLLDNMKLQRVRDVVQNIVLESSMSRKGSKTRDWVKEDYKSIIKSLAGRYGVELKDGYEGNMDVRYLVRSKDTEGEMVMVRDEVEEKVITKFDIREFKKSYESAFMEDYKKRVHPEAEGKGKSREGTSSDTAYTDEELKSKFEKMWNDSETNWRKASQDHDRESIRRRINSAPYGDRLVTAIMTSSRFTEDEKTQRLQSLIEANNRYVASRGPDGSVDESATKEHREVISHLEEEFNEELDDGSKNTFKGRVLKLLGRG